MMICQKTADLKDVMTFCCLWMATLYVDVFPITIT